MKKMFAFTLTEVLIVLSIIGVISALTVPTLINGYQKKAEVVQIRKVINDIESAIDMYITEEGKSKLSATPYYKNDINSLIINKLKYVKSCSANTTGCFATENYFSIDSSSNAQFKCSKTSYLLANSAAICMVKGTNGIITVNVDVNGPDGPNIGGRDMFEFYVNSIGEIRNCSNVANTGTTSDNEKNSCTSSSTGKGCVKALADDGWIMNY